MNKKERTNQSQFSPKEKDKMTELLITDYFDQEQKTKWNKILADKHGVYPPPIRNTKRIQLYRVLAVAATILFLIIIGNNFSKEISAEQLVTQHLEESFPTGNRKGVGEMVDKRAEAKAAYAAKDYKTAIPLFEEITRTNAVIRDDYFYLGLSYLSNNNPGEAVTALLKARTLKPSNFLDSDNEINWFLALAYIRNGDKENAKIELENFIKNSTWKEEEAQVLLEKL